MSETTYWADSTERNEQNERNEDNEEPMSDKSEQEVKVKRDDYDEIEKLGTKFLFVILGVALLGVWSFEYQSLAGMPQTVLPAVALALLAAGGVDVALGRLRK